MKKIASLTIALFSIGGISAILIGYDYFTSTHVISKEQAIEILTKSGQWTPQDLSNDTIDAELLQAKLSNRVAFVINPTTLSPDPSPQLVTLPSFNVQENQLFWSITIKKQLEGQEYREWRYFVDATNGTLLKS